MISTRAMRQSIAPAFRPIPLDRAEEGIALVASVVAGALWNVRVANGRVMTAFGFGAVLALAAVPVVANVRTQKTSS